MRDKILIVITQGFSFRMVIQSGLIRELAKRNEIHLVIPKRQKHIIELQGEANIQVTEYYHRANPLQKFIYLFRKYLLDDVRANIGLLEKHKRRWSSRKSIRTAFYYVFSELLITFRFKWLTTHYLAREEGVFRDSAVRKIIKRINPDLVAVTYPVMFPEPQFLIEAKHLGIKTAVQLLSWDNLLAKGRFISLPDHWIVWGPVMASEVISLYDVKYDNVHFGGVPHFESHFRAKSISKTRTIFFGMSASIYAPNEIEIVEYLVESINSGILPKDLKVVVRPHPQNVFGDLSDKTWLIRLKTLEQLGVKVLWPQLKLDSEVTWEMDKSEMTLLTKFLSQALLSLNSGSTLTIESALVSTPVILTSFDGDKEFSYWRSARRLVDYPHLKKLLSFGLVKSVSSYTDLNKSILEALNNSSEAKHDLQVLTNMYVHKGYESLTQSLNAYEHILELS